MPQTARVHSESADQRHESHLAAVGGDDTGKERSLDRSENGVSRILGQYIVP